MQSQLPCLLADIFSWDKTLPFAVFGAFAAAAWWLLDMLATSKPRAEERLEEFKNPRARRRDGDDGPTKKSATMTKVLAAASPALA
jgi:tight adherence protein C